MPYTLKDRNVLITGGSRGLGALLCEKFAAEGCNIAINYMSNEESAKEAAAKVEKLGVKAVVIQGVCDPKRLTRDCHLFVYNKPTTLANDEQDVGVAEDNARLVKQTVEQLGGLDIIIANAGWTRFAKFSDLNALSHEEWNKCWHTNVMQHLQLVQAAEPIFAQNSEGGVYLITSSVAGKTQGGSSMGYSVTKAAGLHLMKCIAATHGPKIRINAILPGLLLTEWGLKYSPERQKYLKDKALLKQETLLDDCADVFVQMAKNTSMTGQEIVVGKSGFKVCNGLVDPVESTLDFSVVGQV